MAKFKVTFNNIAGELDCRILETVPIDGLGIGRFCATIAEIMQGAPLHDGDSFTIEEIEEGTR